MYKLLPLIMLAGCNYVDVKAGMSFNDERGGQPEITGLVAPLGILRLEHETERENTVFCEHVSSISEAEQGYGLNHCGILFKL